MPEETRADKAVRDATAEIRRETRAATAEVRLELGAAKRETTDALREAMSEVRAALGAIWEPEPSEPAHEGRAGRLSRAQRKEMTRELLLDAAIEVFAEKGYNGASLDDVADAAGFTKGAVYSNFTRKADLFRALLDRESARYTEALTQTIETVPLELLPDVAAELLADPESGSDVQTLRIEFWLAATRDKSLRGVLAQATEAIAQSLQTKLEESGRHPGLDSRELAMAFDALVMGLLMSQALDPDGGQPEVMAKALRKLLADEPPPEAEPQG